MPETTDPPVEPRNEADPTAEPDADQLGDAGTKALDAWKARARTAEKEAKRVKELEQELAKFHDRDKTELQRLEERAVAAEKAAAERESASLRYRVALTKGLPIELAERLRGSTEDELAADAEALMALIPHQPATRGALDQGARQGERPEGSSINDLIRSAVRGR